MKKSKTHSDNQYYLKPKRTNRTGEPHYASLEKENVDQILAGIKKEFDQHTLYTLNGCESKIESNILSYFKSDQAEDTAAFEKLLKGIQKILDSQDSYDKADVSSIWSNILKYTYNYTDTKEYNDHKTFLENHYHLQGNASDSEDGAQ